MDASFASRRVTRKLEAIIAERGAPQVIRCDNGSELTAVIFWPVERKIELIHTSSRSLRARRSYFLDELESGDGNGGKPSSSRNSLCLIVAFWIVFSIISNMP